jgi:site-specific DNA recombinase
MATAPQTPHVTGGPAEPVPVAVLARTSTLALQDPAASLRRQMTSSREWLPPGFYVAGYYWDVESGGLDIEARGHGTYEQFTAQGIPRDGGLADLLTEARSPNPRFAAVVVEDIERASRDFYNSVKLERELSDQGIPLFATDEPADMTGISSTTILVRRVKQGVAEWFRLHLKEQTWKGLREHTAEGWNLGKVPYGYLPEKVTHPNPAKARTGQMKTRLALDPARAPIVAQIYAWRVDAKLAVSTIVARLNADPATYPPAGPAAGWTLGGVAAMLRNPKYTGYQVIGRRHKGRPVPIGQWHWSPAPSHPAIIDRATWDAAQQAGAEHATSRDGTTPHPPATRRSYPLRSRVRCKLCKRRMCGITRTNPERGPAGQYAYYLCPHDPANPRHAAAAPGHPSTVAAPEALLLSALRAGLETYALTPGRGARLAQLIPADAAAKKAKTDAQAAALKTRLKQIGTAQDSLIHDLATLPADPADTAATAMRARIHAHFTDLHHERERIDAQLKTLASDTSRDNDTGLIGELPELSTRLHELPARIHAELLAAFDIQVLWNAPLKQATFFATITDTTPGTITELLTRAAGDDPTATATATPYPGTGTTPTSAGTPATSSDTFSGLSRHPIVRKSRHESGAEGPLYTRAVRMMPWGSTADRIAARRD